MSLLDQCETLSSHISADISFNFNQESHPFSDVKSRSHPWAFHKSSNGWVQLQRHSLPLQVKLFLNSYIAICATDGKVCKHKYKYRINGTMTGNPKAFRFLHSQGPASSAQQRILDRAYERWMEKCKTQA